MGRRMREESALAEEISDDILERYRRVAVATVYSGVRGLGYEPCFMRGVRSFTPGSSLVGRARTLRFVPPRPDIIRDTNRGEDSPEYEAMGSCGPGDVLVCDAMGRKYAAIGGDVKLLQLKMAGAGGIVTDGGIRDLDVVSGYGLKIFARGRTPTGGGPEVSPFEANVAIGCAGVAVRPGDLIVAGDDGVVVVAASIAAEVIEWVEQHEHAEEYVKALIEQEGVAPGRYYPISDATVERSRGWSPPSS